ncbi:ZIP family metal transporter [Caldicellulosiruptor naganoensis]|uniref:ZIP family metal transporter n=1 Tax=Caldicellulosiruptor naganoensis TaxID=29324 RepID=A0ABY7BGU7_9FIRM|nr:ZIP family metal transporter [Caldicellulosiruptor naganoensis]WAM30960.1 ZIP family metal transporter [Caldicellulosiruptor naganoensis]
MDFVTFNLFAFFCGIVGACIGAAFTLFFSFKNEKAIDTLIGFTSGLMLGIISFGLIPEALSLSILLACIAILITSYITIGIIERYLNTNSILAKNKYVKSGVLISIEIAFHNFPEGLAIGSSFIYNHRFGILVGIMIIIHDIPEGFALAIPFKIAKRRNIDILKIAFLSGIPTGIGCLIGSLLSSITKLLMAGCLMAAAGAMLYFVMSEMIPEYSRKENFKLSAISNMIGIVFSLILLEWLEL